MTSVYQLLDIAAKLSLITHLYIAVVSFHFHQIIQSFYLFCAAAISFYRASICEGGLGSRNSVCLYVHLSICLSHAWIVTKLNDAPQIFLYHTKGQSLCYSDTKLVGDAPFPLKSAFKVTHPPSKNADFDRFRLITSQP